MGWSIHHPVGLLYSEPQACYVGFTLLTTNRGDHATLIDLKGRVCHRWQLSEGIGYACLLDNGNLLCRTGAPTEVELVKGLGGSSEGLVELDWNGNVVWRHDDPMIHHDFARLANGNTLVLKWEEMSEEMSAQVQGGYTTDEDPARMLGDVIAEIAPDGSTVYEWRSWEHLSLDEDKICFLEARREWTHGNSLSLTLDGNFLISFRLIDVVAIIDRATGDFNWKWGPGIISHQHHSTQLLNGNVLLFDNGPHLRGISHSTVIEINPVTNDVIWEYKGSPIHSFFSSYISSADRMPNGNTLICEGSGGRIFEVTSNKQVVWEYVNPFSFPDARFGALTNATFRSHRYGPDHPALVGRDLDPARYGNLNRLHGTM